MRLDVWFSRNIYYFLFMREERRGESGKGGSGERVGGENKLWIFQTAVNVFVFELKHHLRVLLSGNFLLFFSGKFLCLGNEKTENETLRKKEERKNSGNYIPKTKKKNNMKKSNFSRFFFGWIEMISFQRIQNKESFCHWHSLEKRFTE